MKKKSILITSIFLAVSIGNCLHIIVDGRFSTVDFISILSVGILIGVLITQIFFALSKQNKSER